MERKISVIDKLKEELLTCPICCEIYVDPRMLPCQHVLCWECLQSYALQYHTIHTFPCPLCKTMTEIPHNGLHNMQKSILTGQIKDILKLGSAKCTYCGSKDDTDVYLCMECSKYTCSRCIVWHSERTHKRDLKLSYVERRLGEIEQHSQQINDLISACEFNLKTSIQNAKSETTSYIERRLGEIEQQSQRKNNLISACEFNLTNTIQNAKSETTSFFDKLNDKQISKIDYLDRTLTDVEDKLNRQIIQKQNEMRQLTGINNNELSKLRRFIQDTCIGLFVIWAISILFISVVVFALYKKG